LASLIGCRSVEEADLRSRPLIERRAGINTL